MYFDPTFRPVVAFFRDNYIQLFPISLPLLLLPLLLQGSGSLDMWFEAHRKHLVEVCTTGLQTDVTVIVNVAIAVTVTTTLCGGCSGRGTCNAGTCGIFFFFFNCMFYQILRVQHTCSSTQSWGSVLPSIIETRDQNSQGCPLLFSNRNLGSFCA